MNDLNNTWVNTSDWTILDPVQPQRLAELLVQQGRQNRIDLEYHPAICASIHHPSFHPSIHTSTVFIHPSHIIIVQAIFQGLYNLHSLNTGLKYLHTLLLYKL